MLWKKGWIETTSAKTSKNLQHLNYRIVSIEEFEKLVKDSNYAHTTLRNNAITKMMAQLLQVSVEDLITGKALMCSQDPLQSGQHLEVEMRIHTHQCDLKFLMEAASLGLESEMKEMIFRAGIKILGVHKSDMEFLSRVIQQKKAT